MLAKYGLSSVWWRLKWGRKKKSWENQEKSWEKLSERKSDERSVNILKTLMILQTNL